MGIFDQLRKALAVSTSHDGRIPSFQRHLNNSEIVQALRKDYGIDLVSVFRLNKILEKMGIVEKTGNGWLLTEEGRKRYTGLNARVFHPDLWHPGLVDAIARFVKQNNIDINKINGKW